ncbi:MAG TPA: hypothetical protein VGQ84_13615 [Gaiellaceae bacterium]|nr:hypothetical protein [Gaiellaceae bacterium]
MRRPATLAFVCLGLAYASLAQGIGWNQLAHYSLVRALADGTPVIDKYRNETGDVSWHDGHYYAAKAPGLAFATVPAFVFLDVTGLKSAMAKAPGAADETVGMLWALGLVGCVLPAFAIALLARRLGDLVEPGFGVLAAVAAGTGTLLLAFATLFFSHVLAAALAFAAFALLWLRGQSPPAAEGQSLAWGQSQVAGEDKTPEPGDFVGTVPQTRVSRGSAWGLSLWGFVAGVLAGLAVVADYPLALAALLVGLYALTRGWRSGALYAGGAALGLVPLLAYNLWAFGSVTHLSYEDAVLVGGATGHDVLGANASGFFGIGEPSFPVAMELLFAPVGVLRLTPVVAAAAAGLVVLYRRGFRAEALLIGGLALSYLVYNSGYFQPFGGFVPGPRFLVPILPFLGVALVSAIRVFPLTTLLLAGISTALMTAVTITGPLLAFDGRWHVRLFDGWFGGRHWYVIAPFVVLVVLAAFFAARAARPHLSVREAPAAAAALAAWALLWRVSPDRLEGWTVRDAALVAALATLGTAAVAVTAYWYPRLRWTSRATPSTRRSAG